ncbi:MULTISPECIES: hypothetical protein [unclassified Colwellia]|uniref:hypothetical protein n=1 Tax=unclassified Colwellia TaxID=196834 RepID=UPI0015F5F198|nr:MULTISPECIES: hypothetical protein [unclassified Colwellia]MBA6233218.1 hypothetical protein [Colwellia sp. MB02u-7]MBA6236308.1 hypothetical protein [Colwellia sp. MB02u-11]MBA6256842.1 hypothetical protein [Colwellia sp. MB3u-28]MBA6261152.1 hypothetical protein [Colwellia sp. MB3u-41]MBA6298292.1 hypothetical protein [Colwellia sp. MB3u-22]
MTKNEFNRMNTLSETVLTLTASTSEIEEFYILLNLWKSSEEFNLEIGFPH